MDETPNTGAHYLTSIKVTTSQKIITLEEVHTRRLIERIEVENEIADIIATHLTMQNKYKR